jgi:hypothetical protein
MMTHCYHPFQWQMDSMRSLHHITGGKHDNFSLTENYFNGVALKKYKTGN